MHPHRPSSHSIEIALRRWQSRSPQTMRGCRATHAHIRVRCTSSLAPSIAQDVLPAFLVELSNLVLGHEHDDHKGVSASARKARGTTYLERKQVRVVRRRCERAHALCKLIEIVLCMRTRSARRSSRTRGGELDNKEDTCLVTTRGTNRAPDMHREGIQGFRMDCVRTVE